MDPKVIGSSPVERRNFISDRRQSIALWFPIPHESHRKGRDTLLRDKFICANNFEVEGMNKDRPWSMAVSHFCLPLSTMFVLLLRKQPVPSFYYQTQLLAITTRIRIRNIAYELMRGFRQIFKHWETCLACFVLCSGMV